MAKQTKSHKQVQIQDNRGSGYQHENTEVFDDNLLPEASEIAALANIDPNILDWLKERAAKEQDFRHEVIRERNGILKIDVKGVISINRMGMVFAFIIIMAGMAFSAFLVHSGQLVTGTIFSGLTVIYAAALFYKRNSAEKNEKPPQSR